MSPVGKEKVNVIVDVVLRFKLQAVQGWAAGAAVCLHHTELPSSDPGRSQRGAAPSSGLPHSSRSFSPAKELLQKDNWRSVVEKWIIFSQAAVAARPGSVHSRLPCCCSVQLRICLLAAGISVSWQMCFLSLQLLSVCFPLAVLKSVCSVVIQSGVRRMV